jgi:hypothetical protein
MLTSVPPEATSAKIAPPAGPVDSADAVFEANVEEEIERDPADPAPLEAGTS